MDNHSSRHPPHPPAHPSRRGRLKKWTGWSLAAIAIFLVAALVFRIALPGLVRDYLNSELADLNDYSGHIENVDIHLWRGAFSLRGVEVIMDEHEVQVPFLDLALMEVALSWSDLWQGAIVAEVAFHEPVLNFVDTEEETDQTGEGTDWQAALQKLVPIEINHIDVTDGQIHFRNFIADPQVDLDVSGINASIVNLTNVDRTEGPSFAEIEATGTVVNDAPVELSAQLDPLRDFRDFDVHLRISDVNLTQLNSLTRAYGNFDFESGVGSVIMELQAEDAQLTGYVRPLLDHVEILDIEDSTEERGVLGTVWEGVVAGLGWVFRNHPEDRLGAQVEIRGTLDQQDVSGWQAFVSVLRNAFVDAYDETFGRE